MALTNTAVKAAKPRDKQWKFSDGGGLYLLIHPNGSKYWRLKFRFAGKEKVLALGVYPEVSLAEARVLQGDAKMLLRNGADPSLVKKQQKRTDRIKTENTFEAIALDWFGQQKGRWSEGHTDRVL